MSIIFRATLTFLNNGHVYGFDEVFVEAEDSDVAEAMARDAAEESVHADDRYAARSVRVTIEEISPADVPVGYRVHRSEPAFAFGA